MNARRASWDEVADRLRVSRSYWLSTTAADSSPHVAPVWGVVLGEALHLYSERRTAKARHVAADPRVVVHLESADDVVIVHGVLEDLGRPEDLPEVVATLSEKYAASEDAAYLPAADPDFDVVWRLVPQRALLWQLPDFDGTQARWDAGGSRP